MTTINYNYLTAETLKDLTKNGFRQHIFYPVNKETPIETEALEAIQSYRERGYYARILIKSQNIKTYTLWYKKR